MIAAELYILPLTGANEKKFLGNFLLPVADVWNYRPWKRDWLLWRVFVLWP